MADTQKREPAVRTSYDAMEAFVILPNLPADENYTIGQIIGILNKNKVTYGIDQVMLKRIVDERLFGREVKVAQGTEKIDGEDGFFQYNFNNDFNKKPEIRADGSVDYWTIHAVEIVEEGQVIALYTEPTMGSNGMTVTGKPIPCKRGRPQPPLVGKGFDRSDDGKVYTANMPGKIEMKNNRIMVSSVHEVNGDVDMQTGNIDFRGDVIIHGNATTGCRIIASGSITIDGTAEGCYLNAGKDIILRGGMVGGEKARIISKGNIFAKFIEYSTVEAEGFIEADCAMNSTIVSYDKIFFGGKHASVVGGSISGCGGVEANNIGNLSEKRTEVSVGVTKKILQEVYQLQRVINECDELVDKINVGIEQFDASAAAKNVDLSKDERRVSLFRARIAKQAEAASARDELERLEVIIERSKGAKVKVIHDVFPGVEVAINDARTRVKYQQSAVEFVDRAGKVVMFSIKDELV